MRLNAETARLLRLTLFYSNKTLSTENSWMKIKRTKNNIPMDSVIDGQHGATTLIAGLVIVLALQVILKVGEFIFKSVEKKEDLKETTMQNLKVSIDNLCTQLATNIEATHRLEERMRAVEGGVSEVANMKTNVRKAFSALKFLAGDEWPQIKKEV